ncbi:MAG: cellulase family glycosylhydrolase [Actinomycetota bacterium]|nr:cellulase family glycosylhydrolase [Actinomycetota bacterium]
MAAHLASGHQRRKILLVLSTVATAVTFAATVLLAAGPARSAPPTPVPSLRLTQSGQWLLDSQGRAVVLHGLNEVFKLAPYEPSASGFSDDDAAFLQANGFDAMRIGVIWAAVEPRPGVYDDGYLASIAQTVQTLAAHGIRSLLDFHQDLYNEKFQGEGAPAWAVQDGGLPNPALGFPFNYFGNLAEDHAWDAFWSNARAGDGVGLQTHYANAWAHVAGYFHGSDAVFGYELINEPWPGTLWEQCGLPIVGCPLFDGQLTAFYQRVTAAIRTADPTRTVWIEPNALFSTVDSTQVGAVRDPHVGWAFHDYCATESEGLGNTLCPVLDGATVAAASSYATQHAVPWLLTEFGATNDAPYLSQVVALADANRLSWLEWAYTGNDKTSSSPNGQALVLDPHQPPTGANVVTGTLKALAEPFPQAVAGTPTAWSFAGGAFTFDYSTARVGGGPAFAAGSETDIAAPAVAFPAGYTVTASGATVVSSPGASTVRLTSATGAVRVSVTIRAHP